jgi:hypothetical protein
MLRGVCDIFRESASKAFMTTQTTTPIGSGPDPLVIDGTSCAGEADKAKTPPLPSEAWTWERTIGRRTFHYLRTQASGWAMEESEGVLAIQMICWHRFVSRGKRTGHRFVIGRHSLWITKAQ